MEIEQDGSRRRTWIFQANPKRYRIEESLRVESDELWNLNQHAQKVRAGDRVLVWMSGPRAGIYAVGSIISDPAETPDTPIGQGYWTNERDGVHPRPRVLVAYERVLIDRPLLKCYLECDPSLDDLQVLRQPRGTNFPVTEEEWDALKAWLEDEPPAFLGARMAQ